MQDFREPGAGIFRIKRDLALDKCLVRDLGSAKIQAILGGDSGGELRQLRLLFERGLPLDVGAFADESVAVRSLVNVARRATT